MFYINVERKKIILSLYNTFSSFLSHRETGYRILQDVRCSKQENINILYKIGPSGLSCFKDMDICHVISCTSCESKGDFVEHLPCYKLHQL